MDKMQAFQAQLAEAETLAPRVLDKKTHVVQPTFTKRAATIIGIKTVQSRFMPVSHEGRSNESYVDKIDLLTKTRAEFIGRKLKGIERRAHIALFREMIEQKSGKDWKDFWKTAFGQACLIPDDLCLACWNCSLFGGLNPDNKTASFARIRYFDTFSLEDALTCIASADGEEMGIGNQVYEDLMRENEGKSEKRGSESYHLYEYVKAGTRFPFITIIESPTMLDVAGYLATVQRADAHGYGKFSANHGKFSTKFLAVANGYPRFSTLDLLEWGEAGTLESHFKPNGVKFDTLGDGVAFYGAEAETVAGQLTSEFAKYYQALS